MELGLILFFAAKEKTLIVMIAAADHRHSVIIDPVDQPVFFGDAPGPAVRQLKSKQLRLADTLFGMRPMPLSSSRFRLTMRLSPPEAIQKSFHTP
jgi:hypothetical protein